MNTNMNRNRIRNASLGLAAILLAAAVFTPKPANAADYKPFTGEKTTWHATFDRYDFSMDDATGAMTPGFQRLEFSIMKRLAFWNVPCQVTLRMLNAYGLIDPFVWQVSPGGAARPWTIIQKELHLLPLYPTLSLHVHF